MMLADVVLVVLRQLDGEMMDAIIVLDGQSEMTDLFKGKQSQAS
jgi:hypothetical protein